MRVLGPIAHALGGREQAVFARELAGLLFVDHQDVDLLEHLEQVLVGDVDPQSHGVEADHRGPLGHGVQHLQLQAGLDIREEQMRGVLVGLGQLGAEVLEAVEVRLQRVAVVHILVIAALPPEGEPPVDGLEPVDVHAARLEISDGLAREVFSDHTHELDRREASSGHREISRRAADALLSLSLGGDDPVDGDASDDQ